MSSLRVLLVDDEPLALERLDALLADMPEVEVVGRAQDGVEAAELIAALKPDLAMLDIQMPHRDGMSIAKVLKGEPQTDVVFVTAFHQFAVDAFEVDAVDYLLKPAEPARLKLAIERARRRRDAGPRQEPPMVQAEPPPPVPAEPYSTTLWVRRTRGLVRVELAEVEWIEAARDYVLLHTMDRSYMYRTTMEALSRRLDPALMVRVSRSAFVRRDAVVRAQRRGRGSLVLELTEGAEVPVGNTYTHAVSREFGMKIYDDAD